MTICLTVRSSTMQVEDLSSSWLPEGEGHPQGGHVGNKNKKYYHSDVVSSGGCQMMGLWWTTVYLLQKNMLVFVLPAQ